MNTNDTQTATQASVDQTDALTQATDATTETSTAIENERLVPVAEAIRYRKRAQAAEQQVGALQNQLGELQGKLNQTQETIAHLERRQKIDALLADADAVDFEVARLLTEVAVEQMSQPDVAIAIADLRRGKPYLFHQRGKATAQAMSARHRADDSDSTHDAAQAAAASGDRRDLLQYLRLRRNGSHALRA